ncbi:hypothetical protein B0H14DRAFT_3501808 [Mycena olivaceomarginata]|nr:hypothetical protein B0H14DRAFT_3501808 [Mycena olivaceomarginata]
MPPHTSPHIPSDHLAPIPSVPVLSPFSFLRASPHANSPLFALFRYGFNSRAQIKRLCTISLLVRYAHQHGRGLVCSVALPYCVRIARLAIFHLRHPPPS